MSLIENKSEYESISIEELDLSVRSYNALHNADILTLSKLIDTYNKGKLLDIRNLGKGSFEELEKKLHIVEVEGISKKQEEVFEDYIIPASLRDISISELNLSNRLRNCFKRRGYKTVGEILNLTENEVMNMYGAGLGTVDEFKKIRKEILKQGEAYFDDTQQREEPANEAMLETIDIDTVRKLKDEFYFKIDLLAKWYAVIRQKVDQLLEQNVNKGNWLNGEFGDTERELLTEMIDKKITYIKNKDGYKAYFLNNRKDDCAVVFVNNKEIRCFFLNMLPDDLKSEIVEKRMDCLTEEESDISNLGEIIIVLKQEHFLPKNSNRFEQLAKARGMSADEYSNFLSGLPVAESEINDDKILEFLYDYYIDGKLMIPSDDSTQWFHSFINSHGYSIEEVAKLYELAGAEIDRDADLSDPRIVEEDMKDYGEADNWINSLFARNPLIGNRRLPDNTREKLYNVTQKYIDQIIKSPSLEVPMIAKMQITLTIITLAKKWDGNGDSGFWRYITSQFGYRDNYGKLRKILCDCVLKAMQTNHRWIVTDSSGPQYKPTIFIHAMSTKHSWMSLFDFIFDFYKNNMDRTYSDDDPMIYRMVEILRNKLMTGDGSNEDSYEIGNKVYTFQEGIRKLIIYRTGYATKLIRHVLHRIDTIIDHKESAPEFYIDELCDLWMEKRIRETSDINKRKTEEKRIVATDYSKIRPVYSLKDETEVNISFPDIRLNKTGFSDARVTIVAGGKEIGSRSLSFYGNELGKSLAGFDIDVDVDKCLKNSNGSLHLRTVIRCNGIIVYDSKDSLFRDVLCFFGEKEIPLSSCKKGIYTFFIPTKSSVDFSGAKVAQVSAGPSFKVYKARLEEDFVVKLDKSVIAFDDDNDRKKAGIKLALPKTMENISYICNGRKLDVLSKSGHFIVMVRREYDLKKARFVMNGKRVSLDEYVSKEIDKGYLYKIPVLAASDNICEYELVDLADNRIISKGAIKLVQDLKYSFDRKIYYSESDYENAVVQFNDGQIEREVHFGADQDVVSISDRKGIYEVKIPRIIVRNEDGSLWERGRLFWIKEFEQNDRIYITCPVDDCEVKLTLGDVEVTEDSNNAYSLGSAVSDYAHSRTDDWIGIELSVTYADEPERYVLGKVTVEERFIEPPKLEYNDEVLYWNKGIRFIGNKKADFELEISANGQEYRYPLDLENDRVTRITEIPLGIYDYRIVERSKGSSDVERERSAGSIVIGDENALRFMDSMINVTHVMSEHKGNLKSCEINVYVDHLEYQGVQFMNTENRECPVYTGIMFYMGLGGKHHEFSNVEIIKRGGQSIYKVNPVNVIYINDHTISITSGEGEGIYYYRRYNRITNSKTYLITDKNPDEKNRKNYSVADLFLYKKVKIQNT